MEKINPEKYIELAAKVQQEAKEAAIALLREKVEGHCIDPDYHANRYNFMRMA